MLSPKQRIVLLPQDRQIMDITGMSEEQYRWFVRQAIFESKLRPGEPVALGPLAVIGINLAIGLLLTAASALLAPKTRQNQVRDNRQNIRQNTVQGQNLVNGAQFTPKAGFDSVQNVVELGSIIPIVYAKRQVLDGIYYGGIRVNTNLIWSQMLSIGGGQLLRAIFLIGEGALGDVDNKPAVDPTQFAIGNNLIGSYDLAKDLEAGRVTVYVSDDTGRIIEDDYVAGVKPDNDPGNAVNNGGADVFEVKSIGEAYEPDFCYVSTPTNQTAFGLYGFIGNGMTYRPNPVFRPALVPVTESKERGEGEDKEVYNIYACNKDRQVLAERRQQNCKFAGRSGLIGGDGTLQDVNVGDELQYVLYPSTDGLGEFLDPQTGDSDSQGVAKNRSIGQAIAGRQRSYDELLSIGEKYKVGSATAICVDRTAAAFESDMDYEDSGAGRLVTATLRVIEKGSVHIYSSTELQLTPQADKDANTATQSSHILRLAEATFITDRKTRILEVGIRSSVQLNINGLCDFSGSKKYTGNITSSASEIDWEACERHVREEVKGDTILNNFNSGTYSSPEARYSCFQIYYRIAGSNSGYSLVRDGDGKEAIFAVRSATGVAVYNYLRFSFPLEERWQIKLAPISGWEVRRRGSNNIEVLDAHYENTETVDDRTGPDVIYTGQRIASSERSDLLGVRSFRPGRNMGTGFDDNDGYQVDRYARLAEAFIYSEVTASTSSPEHQVVYVNTITTNEEFDPSTGKSEKFAPNYDLMALVGLNIRSSKEITSLSQFSVYLNGGRKFENKPTSDFPIILYDLLTNSRYGTGSVVSAEQVERTSFEESAVFTSSRRYFFDGAISERVNLRSWGAETAGHFLLDFMMRNGKFVIRPSVNFNGPEQVTGMFSSGNIIDDTFELSYNDEQERIPPRITVVWRYEQIDRDEKGLFPITREVTVKENDTPDDAPLQKIDISDFCTSEIHAVERAKWECRVRRMVTHSVKFTTVPTQAALDLGAVFKLGMETVLYNQPRNGAISSTGEVTAWPPLADGSYDVVLWDGTGSTLQEVTIVIIDGKAVGITSAVFCLRGVVTEEQTYKVQTLSYDEDGNLEVEAIYWPTDLTGNSLLVKDWDAFIVEGLL